MRDVLDERKGGELWRGAAGDGGESEERSPGERLVGGDEEEDFVDCRVSRSGASRTLARERRQRSAASRSSAVKEWTFFARHDSVAVGKQELGKKK